jgi:hypothetical protein
MTFKFDRRPYGPESTPQEVQAIKECIFLCDPEIIYWRELPVQSAFQLDLFEQRLNELSKHGSGYDLVIDLVEAGPPEPEIRERLKQLFAGQKKLRRVAVFTGKNFMLNVAAKFVLGGSIGLENFSVHQTFEQALREVHDGER